ncbi:hypothetical protein LX64_05107 [Chitinophaga skermanii]|uniref:DUF2185 domain-containing protein n=1 Tax=Chitinophaga skermanii TaxID=331697 RepID=A0A327PZV6_9BACT|nr:hypothetical protein [Chitinophaga skermanii]RAI97599.1 hypothetical protein LX64_05107 [Chitinophaga skermanii]
MPFQENVHTAVRTTRFVLWESKPITLVMHHEEDAMWEFRSDDICLQADDFMMVSLEEMLLLDASLEALGTLPLGMKARRLGYGGNWETQQI